MNQAYRPYSCPFYVPPQTSGSGSKGNFAGNMHSLPPCPYYDNMQMNNPPLPFGNQQPFNPYIARMDYGPEPLVINIEEATLQNDNFRAALWTGKHLQVTLMRINPGEDIGLEIHPDVDQFLRIEEGQGITMMGKSKNNLTYRRRVFDNDVIIIPAGTWHNIVNTGNRPLKLYSIYAPPNHPHGTIHETKADAEEAEQHHMR